MKKQKIHVLPVDDLQPHDESMFCACKPEVRKEGEGLLVIHNAYDGREYAEEDNVKFGKIN